MHVRALVTPDMAWSAQVPADRAFVEEYATPAVYYTLAFCSPHCYTSSRCSRSAYTSYVFV
jgi:hypothetical protein